MTVRKFFQYGAISFLLLFCAPLALAEEQPGDVCAAGEAGAYIRSSMTSATDGGNMLFCDGANWVGFLRFTSSGNLGVWNDTPAAELDITGTGQMDYLKLNGVTGLVAPAGSAAFGLTDLTDAVITTPVNTEVLTYNGTNWVNSAAGGGSSIWTAGTGDDIYYNSGTPQVGIGTAAPEKTLHVVGSGTQPVALFEETATSPNIALVDATDGLRFEYESGSNELRIQPATTDGSWGGITPFIFDMDAPWYSFIVNGNGDVSMGGACCGQSISLAIGDNDTGINQDGDGVLEMWTNGVDRLHITSTGRVGIGDVTPDVELDVVGSITFTGTIQDVSDRRLKTDIVNLPASQLEKLLMLQGVSFKMKDNLEAGTEIGLIAQDVESVYPDLVKTDRDDVKSLNYIGLIAPLIEAIKEQQAQIEELKSEIIHMKQEN